MTRPLSFTKMTAYGNDYIYVIDLDKKFICRDEASRILSERNFSVGSDGLIVVEKSENANFFMRVYNPDGTEAEMCGNGLRSVGKLVYEKGLTDKTEILIETLGGIKTVRLTLGDDGSVVNINADIGKPYFDKEKIPVKCIGERMICEELEILGRTFTATALSLGNPHLVLFCEDVDSLDIARYGACAETLSIFPERTNVEFCRFNSRNTVRLRTWERGTGETCACATGCCAALCAGVLSDMCERSVYVFQNGGKTLVEWDDNGHLHMSAPSKIVFEGQAMLDEKFFADKYACDMSEEGGAIE